ncbi:kinase-like domain-containing protein [Peziza echinospora]|nr:kinase-like domain-containing protein [Peziza echinospora]
MGSDSSTGSYDEEGEIIESQAEKASLSLPSGAGHSVDRHSSRNRESHSPSSYDDRRPSKPYQQYPPNPPGRDQSYRPYEESSRKRRRSEDRSKSDTRQFRVHYERPPIDPRNRPRVSYADIDRNDLPEGSRPPPRLAKDSDDRDYHDFKRSKTRSKSPPRGPRAGYNGGRADRPGPYDDRRDDRRDGARYYDDRRGGHGRHSRERSVSERGEPPVGSELSKRDAEDRYKVSDRKRSEPGPSSLRDSHTNGRSVRHVSFRNYVDIWGENREGPHGQENLKEPSMENEMESTPIDEAKLIEERRKKREAIKAKYRGQSTPLLVSALSIDQSVPNSPAVADSPVSLKATEGSPSTEKPNPIEGSVSVNTPRADSPATFDLVKDDASGSKIEGEEEGPSAADYDPVMDMEEDKKRQEQHGHHGEVSSGSYDETQTNTRDVLVPEHIMQDVEKPVEEEEGKDDDFDMFADEDDDDMFAEESTKPKKRTQNDPAKAVPVIAQAKQLDASMLDNWDDTEGYYRVILGELLDGRYHVQANLGKGMFSGVVRAMDTKLQKLVAIKIIRNNETMKKAGMKEIEIIKKLNTADPEDRKHLVRLERYFEHKSHLCLVFEHLSINLREVLKKFGRDVGISLKAVRAYAHQMFLGLALMRKANILHADLKPDNLLVNEGRNILKICDLGSASDASENEITPYLVSRYYRAPEIILGMPYDFAIDVWSIGCTLYELYTGKILFTGRTNNQMLRSMMECRGKFSHKLLRKGQFTNLHFDDMLNFRSVEKDKITGRDIVKLLNFHKPTRELRSRLLSSTSNIPEAEMKELGLFVDLLEKCLNLNPEKRCTPAEALKHPFIHRPLTK